MLTGPNNIEKRQCSSAAKTVKTEPKKRGVKRLARETSTSGDSDEGDDRCKECKEYYYLTKEECDWIKCCECERWLHENCTIFTTFCIDCGRRPSSKNKSKKCEKGAKVSKFSM